MKAFFSSIILVGREQVIEFKLLQLDGGRTKAYVITDGITNRKQKGFISL